MASPLTEPNRLYTSEELLAGFDPLVVGSYSRTFDARMYLQAVEQGLRAPEDLAVARDRALHDLSITVALRQVLRDRLVVAIMGGHGLSRSDPAYRTVALIARELTRRGFLVLSGGGPGAMEATHLGARVSTRADPELDQIISALSIAADFPTEAALHLVDGRTFDVEALAVLHAWQAPAFVAAARTASGAGVSIGIPTWLYGHEPPTPFATHHAKYYENSIREDGLLAVATSGVVFAPGGPGTVQEIFQDLAQNAYRTAGIFSPMVLLDLDGYWTVTHPVRTLVESLLPDDDERFTHYVIDAAEAVDVIASFDGRQPG